jgi:GcrA cell cycle regulator
MSWTPERIDLLRGLLAGGATASQAGKALGATRNAIIGKAHRMGFAMRSQNTGGFRERAPVKAARPPRNTPPKPRSGPTRAPRVTPGEMRTIALICEPVGLLDLLPTSCRWPVAEDGGHLFCGARMAGDGPYCDGHARIAFRTPATTANELVRSLRRYAA